LEEINSKFLQWSNITGFLKKNPKLGQILFFFNWMNPGVDGRIILRWICRKCDVRIWTG
jgi:hypothetical protein